MIRGDTVYGLTTKQLNDLTDGGSVLHNFYEKHGVYEMKKAVYDKFHQDHQDKIQDLLEKENEWYSSPLYGSIGLRTQAVNAGYKILEIYPIYHQGWEMDDWGAIGEKDGKKWQLETSHGGLIIPTEPIKGITRTVMSMLGFD